MENDLALAGIPRYLVIAEDLKKRIQSGEYTPGSFIPNEQELQKNYGVSRPTIRSAIAKLRELNLVEVVRGTGTRVVRPSMYQMLSNQLSFTEVIQSQGMKPGTKVTHCRLVKPPAIVEEKLGLASTDMVNEVDCLRLADNQVISYHISYLRREFDVDPRKLEEVVSLYRYLEKYHNLVIEITDDIISAESANTIVARMLEIHVGTPVLVLNRVAYNQNDEPVEYALSYIGSDRLKYRVTMKRGKS